MIAGAAVLFLAGILGISPWHVLQAKSGQASCAIVVKFRGATYSPLGSVGGYHRRLEARRFAGRAYVPPCNDVPSQPSQSIEVRQTVAFDEIRGVNPAVA